MPVIGAIQESLSGPGTITHEGGDPILVADLVGGLPQEERTLVFEGEERVVDGDDEFHPVSPDGRSIEIGEAVLIRALGQANYTFTADVVEEEPEAEAPKPKAKKRAAKKKAAPVAA